MPLIKIRQLEERTATKGLFMGGDLRRRKLEPGEIVDIPDDLTLEDGRNLMKGLWETGLIDMVPDNIAVTRPFEYANPREAKLCSPTYNPTGPDEVKEKEDALARVEARLLEQSDSPPDAESPEEDDPEPPPLAAQAVRRRGRGTRPKVADHGAEITT